MPWRRWLRSSSDSPGAEPGGSRLPQAQNPLQGALAGGGDPATSPLYVFGPFLRLIVAAGVAEITFGASVWLVILTIAVVSAMYRLVMGWVTDGSGGSGLGEEEFGGWAVKVNTGITFIEYTLTFLVSMAALVTFAADRLPRLNQTDFLIENRARLAVGVSIATGWLVNRGPATTAPDLRPGDRRRAHPPLGDDRRDRHRDRFPPARARPQGVHAHLLEGHVRRLRPDPGGDDRYRDIRQHGGRLRGAPDVRGRRAFRGS